MKWWALLLVGALSGCMSGNDISFDVLDTAPSEQELRHPEWGNPSQAPQRSDDQARLMPVTNEMYQRHYAPQDTTSVSLESSVASLHSFLESQQIEHEFITGDYKMIRLKEQVRFHTGSAQLSTNSLNWVNKLGRYLAGRPDIDVVIEGHTDSNGNPTANEKLSARRAKSVENQFLSNYLPRQRVYTRSFGEYMPQCSNQTSIGQACNRRVELTLIVGQ